MAGRQLGAGRALGQDQYRIHSIASATNMPHHSRPRGSARLMSLSPVETFTIVVSPEA